MDTDKLSVSTPLIPPLQGGKTEEKLLFIVHLWLIILLCGGDKSTQEKDIARAKEYWEDYRSRDDA